MDKFVQLVNSCGAKYVTNNRHVKQEFLFLRLVDH